MKEETMDLTPTWAGVLPAMLLIYSSGGTAAAQQNATAELTKMAKLADLYVEHHKSFNGWDESTVATKYVYERLGDALNGRDVGKISQVLSDFYSELAHNYKVDTGRLIGEKDDQV